ncbi:MAG: NifB/NifX family molybdenum-iron cluster-binding protein [Thermodesulfobacteriota bacterium]
MRIAVTSAGRDLDAEMDPRFGRAQYILIVDEDGTLIEAVDNSAGVNARGGAGIQAGKTVADRHVEVLITGNCGPNAFRTLQAAGVKVVVRQTGSVREALARLKRGELAFAESPNVEAHW